MHKRMHNRPRAKAAKIDRETGRIAAMLLLATGALLAAQILLLTSP